jgi:hypothetical protein
MSTPQERLASLTPHDWLQIDQAARGCISGTSDEWPHLCNAIAKLTGRPLLFPEPSAWLRGFCSGILAVAEEPEIE